MKSPELKITRIGNSRGVRLPADLIRRYRLESSVLVEETADGIVLRPSAVPRKLTWAETAEEMAAEAESWSDWEAVVADGLESIPWESGKPSRVSEKKADYRVKAKQARLQRFEIYWADLGPIRGAEMGKARPVVIVSRNELNDRLQTVVVCPLTTSLHPTWRSRLAVEAGGRSSEIAVDQIRTIGKERLGRRLGVLSEDEAAALARLIAETYGV